MSEVKQDLPFKLFGKTISLPADKEAPVAYTTTHTEQRLCSSSTGEVCNRVDDDEDVYDHKKPSQSILTDADQESIHAISNQAGEECKDRAPSSSMSFDKPRTPSAGKEPTSHEASKSDEQSEASVSEDKTLKKPDKIIPCPRCNSMETKFCYHNNYNVNQPRHFCKKCQRYWTAGGNMRNVPVGSGRRKSKSSCPSQYQHIMVSDSAADGIRPHGTVLAFGSDATPNVGRNLDHEAKGGNLQPLAPHVPCFQGPPWALPWNPLQWGSAIPPGTMTPSGYPMAFYPTPPYWGCGMPGAWSTSPWPSPLPAQAANLGKHSKDEEMLEDMSSSKGEKCSERRVWTPKTLRMDDQTEAVRSSIWSSLGVKNVNHAPTSLQSRGDEKRQRFDTSLVLQANPAAFSRSLNFREAV